MEKLNMSQVRPKVAHDRRDKAEERALAGVDGRARRRRGRNVQMILRFTKEERQEIVNLADALGGLTFVDTVLKAVRHYSKTVKGDN